MSEGGVEEWLPDDPGPPPMGWYNWVLALAVLDAQPRASKRPPLPGVKPVPHAQRSLKIAKHLLGTGPTCPNCSCGRKHE